MSDDELEAKHHYSFVYEGNSFTSFDDIPLHENLLRGIYSYGFERPSQIQQRAIVPLIQGVDMIAQSHSETGKTCALSIGLLQRVDFQCRALQCLVLSPTADDAQHTAHVIRRMGEFFNAGDFCATVGHSRDDPRTFHSAVVGVGTPAGVLEILKRRADPSALRTVAIDEADAILSRADSAAIYEIFTLLPKDIQVALFAQSTTDEMMELTKKFMRTPTRTVVKTHQLSLCGIRHFYIDLKEGCKIDALMKIFESGSIERSVIYANTVEKVDLIADKLNTHNSTVLHAAMQRIDRERAMMAFHTGSARVLVTTHLSVRGIDVNYANIVINFDLPTKEIFLQRAGRCGSYGRKGITINFISPLDVEFQHEIERYYEIEMEELPVDFADCF